MCDYIVKTIIHSIHHIPVRALVSYKKKIFIPFISNCGADQNQQMILKVAIGAVHHLTRLEVSLK